MSIWALATDVAIWTLIAGSLAVFGWFLIAVLRLAREAPLAPDDVDASPDADDSAPDADDSARNE